jgi:hypothetical protein
MRSYCRRLRIWETIYGRDAGWVIERQGRRIAVLTDPRPEDMFWDSYRMDVVADDPELARRMQTKEFWAVAEAEGLVWRSLEFGDVAAYAFPAMSPFPKPGRLMMRGLHLAIGAPWPWDWVVLWARRRKGRCRIMHDDSGST